METVVKKYKVNYVLNAFDLKEGVPQYQPERSCELETDTDDLRYLFKDLSELHQKENVVGLKIIGVQEL